MDSLIINPVARIYNGYTSKFGIPRQAGLVQSVDSQIIFEPAYRNPDSLRGLENISHIWLIWEFSRFTNKSWTPLIRPPRLGGNRKLGVFATRSPLRPNPLALSAVRLLDITFNTPQGPVLNVAGADIMNGTPIYDIKPYIPYADALPQATAGIFSQRPQKLDDVILPSPLPTFVSVSQINALKEILIEDPRPAYKTSPDEVYAFEYGNIHVEFVVKDNIVVITELSEQQ